VPNAARLFIPELKGPLLASPHLTMSVHSGSRGARAVVLLGPQRFGPSLGAVVSSLHVTGKIAVITAGWQEREAEDEELSAHLDGRTVNLRLYARAEDVFRSDPELGAAHRERQQLLQHRQDFYRIRLEHELDAQHVIQQRRAPPTVLGDESNASIRFIRELDAWHVTRCKEIHEEFNARWDLANRPVVARHRREIKELVGDCEAIAIAGGHVATLKTRLVLFAIETLIFDRAVFAWSGGAMAISERIVLFHDDPPQGPGASQVLDAGLGIVPGVVVLPEPERRLRLERKDRVGLTARRFRPALCLAFPARTHVTWQSGRFTSPEGVILLRNDGEHVPFDAEHGAEP
jgi:hypothetical protein